MIPNLELTDLKPPVLRLWEVIYKQFLLYLYDHVIVRHSYGINSCLGEKEIEKCCVYLSVPFMYKITCYVFVLLYKNLF